MVDRVERANIGDIVEIPDEVVERLATVRGYADDFVEGHPVPGVDVGASLGRLRCLYDVAARLEAEFDGAVA